jgi:serine/tyrosine/threonine adenylyltransferase
MLRKSPALPKSTLIGLSRRRPAFSSACRIMAGQPKQTAAAGRLEDLPKSWHFTSSLPHDTFFPTPAASHKTPRDQIQPRLVRGALYTWVRPQPVRDPELLCVSPAALHDLGINDGAEKTADFLEVVCGNRLLGWDEAKEEGGYPWAQCYGGFQFGSWAGQLGDGRAISLFETTNPTSGIRYELQLKGAGLTPYSRFADGMAVLRSSIREFIVSEFLNALGIPSTRALALTHLKGVQVVRETVEPGAIVLRFAQSWLRLGNFDILRARGDRTLIRKLATYVAEHVLGGWEALPGRLQDPEKPAESPPPRTGIGGQGIEGPPEAAENRFARLYREVVRRNAETVAKWQAYGFMNGVLNTDNTSIMGLSIDFGPFAFMDNFDPSYTPNHDDHMLRYSYKNQPTIIWWNLVRFGEAIGELLGAGPFVDDLSFEKDGVRDDQEQEVVSRAEKLITQAGEEYKATFLAEYRRVMGRRLGLKTSKESDLDDLFHELLSTMETLELDFNHVFRRLSSVSLSDIDSAKSRQDKASLFFHPEGVPCREDDARQKMAEWLARWRLRVIEDWGENGQVSVENDAQRQEMMKQVNPSFVPRGWILDEIIRRVEKDGGRDILRRAMHMALHPFEESWHGREFQGGIYQGDPEEEQRWIGDVPQQERALQCSCSS